MRFRMYTASRHADARTFEVNTERNRHARIVLPITDLLGEPLDCLYQHSYFCRNRSGKKRSHSVFREESTHLFEAFPFALHHVVTGRAVNVEVDKAGCEDRVSKIYRARIGRSFHRVARAHCNNSFVFNNNGRITYAFR